ncbi:MAG TPA: helix-turn-helix domain-containing protein [Solirubrobacteraceae bacterium]
MSGYFERLVSSSLACCTWEQQTAVAWEQRVVPDACVDLLWSGDRLSIAGPDTRARVVALDPGARIVGVRLRPGAAGEALGLPASELRDAAPDAADVLGRDRAETLLASLLAGNNEHALLLAAVCAPDGRRPDPLVGAAVAALDRPHARVAPVAAELGVSARQLQRRVADAVGYGPKMLARVLRFRRLQSLAPAPLVELALEAGYADQAHMTAEVTELAGISPVRFLKDRTPTAA